MSSADWSVHDLMLIEYYTSSRFN